MSAEVLPVPICVLALHTSPICAMSSRRKRNGASPLSLILSELQMSTVSCVERETLTRNSLWLRVNFVSLGMPTTVVWKVPPIALEVVPV